MDELRSVAPPAVRRVVRWRRLGLLLILLGAVALRLSAVGYGKDALVVHVDEEHNLRVALGLSWAQLNPHEVPLNFLNPRPGTPFGDLEVLPAADALRDVAAFRLALPRTMLRFAGGREITLGDLGAKQGILGGINAVIVGNYLTTLGRPAEADLELLDGLQMPIKALNATL